MSNPIITFFIRSNSVGFSMGKHYRALIGEISNTCDTETLYEPCYKFTMGSIIKNIFYTFSHRNKRGINHVTGDVHYVMMGLIGCKSVLTVHDMVSITFSSYNSIKKKILFFIEFYIPLKIATRIVAITEKTKEEIIRYLPSVKDKIVVLHHISIDEFKYTPKIFNKECPVILQNGTSPNKNLETTIRALRGIKCKLRVIRPMSEAQKALAEECGIDYTNVYNIPDEQLLEEYHNADIVVFPSIYEGFGAITIEAQAIGRPVITSNLEPMASVANGGALLLNNPKDEVELRSCINQIINDEKLRDDLISKGLENIQQYTKAACAQQHIDFYKTML